MSTLNPYAVYVRCDAGMDYDSRNTGAGGILIEFPEHVGLKNVEESVGKYQDANIERLELEAIIQGMQLLLRLAKANPSEFRKIDTVIIITDRHGLVQRTKPFVLNTYRRNKWKNHEGKEVKNSDLLNDLDKIRAKTIKTVRCSVSIEWRPRKDNKVADRLAKGGKKKPLAKRRIDIFGQKIGKRKLSGGEITYKNLSPGIYLTVHVFMKRSIGTRWEISAEVSEGEYYGLVTKIYTDSALESKLHRHHTYLIRVKDVFSHHLTMYRTVIEKFQK